MSYTTVEQVRRHLKSPQVKADRIYDQKFVFASDDYLVFYGAAVETGSLKVKSIRGEELNRGSLTRSAATVNLAAQPLVPGSVVVASDSSLGTIYSENEDYSIDYNRSELTVRNVSRLTSASMSGLIR